MENIDHPLLHWIPYKLIEKDGEVYFEWIYLGEKGIQILFLMKQ